jgi:hypothetical protein
MIVYGTRCYGRVDELEELGAVETKFFHLFWVPLIPLGSMFVFDDDEGLDDGEKRFASLPFSFKSMLVAWTRALFVLFGLTGSIAGISGLIEGDAANSSDTRELLLLLGLGVVSWFLVFVVGALAKHCSPSRREGLLRSIGYAPPHGP